MNIKWSIVLCLFICIFPFQVAFPQKDISIEHYEEAYLEIKSMLEGKMPLFIKRAVFLSEWAYLDGKLDYEKDFCEPLQKGADYKKNDCIQSLGNLQDSQANCALQLLLHTMFRKWNSL